MIVFDPKKWRDVDLAAAVGDNVTLPDGSKKPITLRMHEWIWWKLMHEQHPDLPMQLVTDTLNCIASSNVPPYDVDNEFAALLEEAIQTYAVKFAKAFKGID